MSRVFPTLCFDSSGIDSMVPATLCRMDRNGTLSTGHVQTAEKFQNKSEVLRFKMG